MDKEKQIGIYKLGLTLQKIIEENKIASLSNDQKHNAINSLRKLAASSRVEFSIIQKISTGKRNPSFSTILNLVDGLNMSLSDFSNVYDSISEEDAVRYKREIEKKKLERDRKKEKLLKKKASKKKK